MKAWFQNIWKMSGAASTRFWPSGDSKDYNSARRLGHQFKGSGAGYGFPEITRTGAAVELAAKATDPDEIRSQILALASYLDRVEIVV